MFLLVGKGVFTKDKLVDQLSRMGFNAAETVKQAEDMGRAECGRFKILVIR